MKMYWYARAAFMLAIGFLAVFFYGMAHFLLRDLFDFLIYMLTLTLFWFMIAMDKVCDKKEKEIFGEVEQIQERT